MSNDSQKSEGLGSLSQAARGKTLGSARIILILVGLLTIGANGFLFYTAEKQADTAIQVEIKKLAPGMVADQQKVAEAKTQIVKVVKLVAGGTIVLGVIFIALGVVVYKIPVVATVLGLVLYVGATIIFGLVDPSSMVRGIIVKVFIVVGLVKAVQTAIAYQKDLAFQKFTGV